MKTLKFMEIDASTLQFMNCLLLCVDVMGKDISAYLLQTKLHGYA